MRRLGAVFLASALARSHWYDLEPARRDLGYRIRVPMEEATRRTARWLAERLELGGAAESSLRLTANRIGTSPLPERPRVYHVGKRSPRS